VKSGVGSGFCFGFAICFDPGSGSGIGFRFGIHFGLGWVGLCLGFGVGVGFGFGVGVTHMTDSCFPRALRQQHINARGLKPQIVDEGSGSDQSHYLLTLDGDFSLSILVDDRHERKCFTKPDSQSQIDKDVVKMVVHALRCCMRSPMSFTHPDVKAPYLFEDTSSSKKAAGRNCVGCVGHWIHANPHTFSYSQHRPEP
jgi:hypothetical protein